jgi:hypothetical protein
VAKLVFRAAPLNGISWKQKPPLISGVGCGPQSVAMTLDNGSADGQAHPHSATLGRVEGVEESLHFPLADAHARNLYRQAHTIAFVSFGSDDQHSRTIEIKRSLGIHRPQKAEALGLRTWAHLRPNKGCRGCLEAPEEAIRDA